MSATTTIDNQGQLPLWPDLPRVVARSPDQATTRGIIMTGNEDVPMKVKRFGWELMRGDEDTRITFLSLAAGVSAAVDELRV